LNFCILLEFGEGEVGEHEKIVNTIGLYPLEWSKCELLRKIRQPLPQPFRYQTTPQSIKRTKHQSLPQACDLLYLLSELNIHLSTSPFPYPSLNINHLNTSKSKLTQSKQGHKRVDIAKFFQEQNVGYKQVIETI
jgi:hypothetical protein